MLYRDVGTVGTTRQHILQAQLIDLQPIFAETIPLILTSHNIVLQFLSLSCLSVHWRWFKCCVWFYINLFQLTWMCIVLEWFFKLAVALVLCWFLISCHADHILKKRCMNAHIHSVKWTQNVYKLFLQIIHSTEIKPLLLNLNAQCDLQQTEI